MLKHSREYSDGKYRYAIIPLREDEEYGNAVILENVLENRPLKKYFTNDDETAIAIFESMIELHDDRGAELLEKYKIAEILSKEYSGRVTVELE